VRSDPYLRPFFFFLGTVPLFGAHGVVGARVRSTAQGKRGEGSRVKGEGESGKGRGVGT